MKTIERHDVLETIFRVLSSRGCPLLFSGRSRPSVAGIEVVAALDERNAVWMAGGWANGRSQPGAVLVEGGTAVAGALADLKRDRIPLVCMVTSASLPPPGTTKRAFEVASAERTEEDLAAAFEEAGASTPGPVVVSVPPVPSAVADLRITHAAARAQPPRTDEPPAGEPTDAMSAFLRIQARPTHPMRLIAEIAAVIGDRALCIDGEGLGLRLGDEIREAGDERLRVISGGRGRVIPHAVGLELASGPRAAVVLTGAESFAVSALELATARRFGLALPVVVAGPADALAWERVADVIGGHGERVDDPDSLSIHLRNALAATTPSVINAIVGPTTRQTQ